MLDSRRTCTLLAGLITLSLILYPFFSYSALKGYSDLQPPDITYIVGAPFWLYLIFLQGLILLFTVSIFRIDRRKPFYLFLVFVIVLVLFGLYPLGQLPRFVVQSSDDFFYHISISRMIIEQGELVLIPEEGYTQYPGCQMFVVALIEILGLNVRLDAAYFALVLDIVLNLTIATCIFILARKILGESGYIVPIVYLIGNTAIGSTVNLFGPSKFGFCLYLIALLMMAKMIDSKITNIRPLVSLIILTSVAVIISHPISAVFLVSTLVGLSIVTSMSIGKALKARVSLILAFLVVILWLSWWAFFATPNFIITVDLLTRLFSAGASMNLPSLTSTGAFLSQLVYVYSRALYGFVGIAALLGLIILKRKWPHPSLFFIAIGLGTGVAGVFSIAMAGGTWGDRFILFGYLPLTGLAVFGITRFKRMSRIFVLILILCLPLTFILHHRADFYTTVHKWDITPCEFLQAYKTPRQSSSGNPWALSIYSYFVYTLRHNRSRSPFGHIYVRSWRDSVYKSYSGQVAGHILTDYWQTSDSLGEIVRTYIGIETNKIYDNGFVEMYYSHPHAYTPT